MVDPDAPSVTVWRLRDGSYVEVVDVAGADELAVEAPFPVRFRPDDLVG